MTINKPNKYTRKRRRQADGRRDIYMEAAHDLIKEEVRSFLTNARAVDGEEPTHAELREFGDKCRTYLRHAQLAKQAAWNKNAFNEPEPQSGPAAEVIPPADGRKKWIVRFYMPPDETGVAKLHAAGAYETEEEARGEAAAWVEVEEK